MIKIWPNMRPMDVEKSIPSDTLMMVLPLASTLLVNSCS
jgi:hypothetical protein